MVREDQLIVAEKHVMHNKSSTAPGPVTLRCVLSAQPAPERRVRKRFEPGGVLGEGAAVHILRASHLCIYLWRDQLSGLEERFQVQSRIL